jgi:hypothetical protein
MRALVSTLPSERSSRWAVLVIVMALWALATAGQASASHFRYGHYNWHPVAGNTIDFTIQNAFRRDGYSCVSTVSPHPTVPCTGPGGAPGIGDVIEEFIGFTTFSPGDSTTIGSPLGPLMYVVTSIDPANNWLLGSALDPNSLPLIDTMVTHSYGVSGDYLANTDSSARISSATAPNYHLNNPNGGYRVETLVNVAPPVANSSPVSGMPPIVLCPINAVCSFQVPASDPNGDPLNYRLSTAAEASSSAPGANWLGTSCSTTFCQPGPPFSTFAASISSTGLYTWNTTGAQLASGTNNTLYSTQVTIEDLNPTGGVKSKVAVDFLIQLVESIGNPPVFDQPPTPTCGSTITGNVGSTMTFTVQASDPDMGDVVTLNVAGLPPGATMTPPLPAMGNPVSSVFNWTPSAPGTFVVTFTATDQTFQQALCPLTLVIQTGPPPPPPCPPDDDDDNDGLTNRNENLLGTLLGVSDSDHDGIVDGNDDSNGNGEDDEDEDDDDDCPDEDDDGDGTDDEDEDDDEDDD